MKKHAIQGELNWGPNTAEYQLVHDMVCSLSYEYDMYSCYYTHYHYHKSI